VFNLGKKIKNQIEIELDDGAKLIVEKLNPTRMFLQNTNEKPLVWKTEVIKVLKNTKDNFYSKNQILYIKH